jgi:hypothetical protein
MYKLQPSLLKFFKQTQKKEKVKKLKEPLVYFKIYVDSNGKDCYTMCLEAQQHKSCITHHCSLFVQPSYTNMIIEKKMETNYVELWKDTYCLGL